MRTFWLCLLATAFATGPVLAESTSTVAPADPATNPQTSTNEKDAPFGSSGSGFNMMNLIHQANMGSNRSPDQFKRDRDRKLDEAINSFRATELRITPKLLPVTTESAPAQKP